MNWHGRTATRSAVPDQGAAEHDEELPAAGHFLTLLPNGPLNARPAQKLRDYVEVRT
jgi:hypothetical protein